MSLFGSNTGLLIALCVIVFISPIIIGIYVFRDCKARGMKPVGWTLLSIFVPFFIGFIVYLVMREDNFKMTCPKCGELVKEDYQVCPSCGVALQNHCPKCQASVKPSWKFCPSCEAPLPENMISPVQIRKKDRGLIGVLVIVVLVPILLIGGMVAGIVFSNDSVQYASLYTDIPTAQVENQAIKDWMADCDRVYQKDKSKTCFAISYKTKRTPHQSGNDAAVYYDEYLVYSPIHQAGDAATLYQDGESVALNVSGKANKGSGLYLIHVEHRSEYDFTTIIDDDEIIDGEAKDVKQTKVNLHRLENYANTASEANERYYRWW